MTLHHEALTGAPAQQQEPWCGQVPPHGAMFTFAVQETGGGKIVTFTCPECGATLGAILWGNPASKLPAEWWVCRKCGCNEDVGVVVA